MKSFKELPVHEQEALLKFPAYITLLAANSDKGMDEIEKKSAIKFVHIKTYSCRPILSEFYHEAEKEFKNNIIQLDKELPKNRDQRELAIKKELRKLEPILLKLGKEYAFTMHHSMKTFKDHVSRAHRNVLEYFLFPLPIPGITD
ncbi:MAG TPA: hypothetical protein VH396_15770 [Chitinophagaceae bacterium]